MAERLFIFLRCRRQAQKRNPIGQRLHIGRAAPIMKSPTSAPSSTTRALGYTGKENPCRGVKKHPKSKRDIYIKTRSAKNKISAYFFLLESISTYFLRNVFYLFRVRFQHRVMPLCAIVIHAHHRHRPRQNHRARGVGKFRQFRAGLCQISGQANAR